MIQNNNNFSIIPFYADIDEQNHRKFYAFGHTYTLYAPANVLLPFQLMRPTRNDAITNVSLFNCDGTLFADVTAEMTNAGLQIVKFPNEGYDIIVFPGINPMTLNQPNGEYYLTITDGVQTWYSDIITIIQDVTNLMKIEWWDVQNLVFDAGQIVYRNPSFHNILYLQTELGKPEYEFEEEGKNRDGYYFPEKQLSIKKYKCVILAPEYMCDVMRFIRMADHVVVTDKYGRVYECDTFLITPKWQTQGDLASVEIEFQTNTVVKKIGRAYMINGDFNDDFNDDYLNNK